MPDLKLFCALRCFPAGVFGPVERWAFRRLAASFRSEIGGFGC